MIPSAKQKIVDITKSLISSDDLFSILLAIFPDTIFLNLQFNILSLGGSIAADLGYSERELEGSSIQVLSDELPTVIGHRLLNGYFEEEKFHVRTKDGEQLMAGLSGFYTGLLTDVNGFIVLRFRNLDGVKSFYKKLEAKTDELDQFIYQAAHSLRGPLATIKGLTRIGKAEGSHDKGEMEYIVNQIGVFSEMLDEQLHRLTFLAEVDKEEQEPREMDFTKIDGKLRETVEQHSPDRVVNFTSSFEANSFHKTNDALLCSLLINLFSFLVSQPKKSENNLRLELFVDETSTEILIRLHGFSFSEEKRKILADEAHSYAELLRRPDMLFCYAAHKILVKMHGGISFNFLSNEDQVVIIYFPHHR
jgi:signal transduction histidine kinase